MGPLQASISLPDVRLCCRLHDSVQVRLRTSGGERQSRRLLGATEVIPPKRVSDSKHIQACTLLLHNRVA